MSSGGKKRAWSELSSEEPLQQKPVFENSDLLANIVRFSPKHLRLRLVSKDWNQGVINAHCNSEESCQKCVCNSSLNQFHMKRLLLSWIPKWDFTTRQPAPPATLVEMIHHHQPSGRTPIISCILLISDNTVLDAEIVFLSSQMQRLKELQISDCGLSDQGRVRLVAALAKLEQLEHLTLSKVFVHDDDSDDGRQQGLHRLIQSFPNLKSFAMNGYHFDQGLLAFSSSPSVSNLEHLEIQGNRLITSARLRDSIASSPFLTNLTSLSLQFSPIGDEGIVAICQSTSLVNLKKLNLRSCGLTVASVDAMIASARMNDIESLDVNRNAIGAAGLVRLLLSASKPDAPFSKITNLKVSSRVSGPEFSTEVATLFSPLVLEDMVPLRQPNLELAIGLWLEPSTFDELAVSSLAKIPLMASVCKLYINCSSELGPSHIFSSSSRFTSLKSISIKSPRVTWKTLSDLTTSPLACQIHTLSLFSSRADPADHLDDGCCKVLADSPCLGHLKTLEFDNSNFSVSIGLITLLSSKNLPSLIKLRCTLRNPRSLAIQESKTEAEAATTMIELLTTTSKRIKVLSFPRTDFGNSVKALVQERIQSVNFE